MKILAFLLLFLTASGSFVPCCQDECIAEAAALPGDPQEEKEGACSPLFSCAANPAFVVLANAEFPPTVYLYKLKHQAGMIHFDLESFSTQILQPPRRIA